MLIREHPELQPWPPTSGLAFVGLTAKQKEVGSLILKIARIAAPARIVMQLSYKGGDCIYTVDFKEMETARTIHRALEQCTGMPLKQIGVVEVRS